ncbi:hypothetical protein FACS189474_2590 [Bacteroidia bacterium]|nr:hypothetical protein FACS189474_2590 [Bacteroidia bacterium]
MKTKTLLVIFATFVIIAMVAFVAYFIFFPKKTETVELLTASESAQKEPFELFNGKNLDGWGFVLKDSTVNAGKVFSVKDGWIDIAGEPFGYMYSEAVFSNFQLHIEWRWPGEATNSGIFLFVQDDKKVWPNAIECQLHAGDAGDFVLLGGSDLAEFQLPEGEERPDFPKVKKKEASSENPAGEWNTAEITCENGSITVYINGVLQNKGTQSLHKQGRIALQSEGKEIQFRNVRITELPL